MHFRNLISGYSTFFWAVVISYIFIFIFVSGCSKVNEVKNYSEKDKIEKVINTSIGWDNTVGPEFWKKEAING